jgi:transcriptional regulator with XRE-family HTH domain
MNQKMEAIYVSNIAELRKQKNLTQRQLADLVGVDPSTIRNWERNRGGVETFMRLAKLCEALNCQPRDLFKSGNLNAR